MNPTRFAYWVTIWVVHLPEQTKPGGPNYRIGPDCWGACISAVAGLEPYLRKFLERLYDHEMNIS